MLVLLRKFERDRSMNRWYMITIQASLLEPVAVVCAYGSWETSWQQLRVLPVFSQDEAQAVAATILRQKLQRGYEIVEEI